MGPFEARVLMLCAGVLAFLVLDDLITRVRRQLEERARMADEQYRQQIQALERKHPYRKGYPIANQILRQIEDEVEADEINPQRRNCAVEGGPVLRRALDRIEASIERARRDAEREEDD